MPPDNKPLSEPMLIEIYVVIRRHLTKMGWYILMCFWKTRVLEYIVHLDNYALMLFYEQKWPISVQNIPERKITMSRYVTVKLILCAENIHNTLNVSISVLSTENKFINTRFHTKPSKSKFSQKFSALFENQPFQYTFLGHQLCKSSHQVFCVIPAYFPRWCGIHLFMTTSIFDINSPTMNH